MRKLISITAATIIGLLLASGTPATEEHVFFGNLHSHTSFSDGSGTPAQAYKRARTGGVRVMSIPWSRLEAMGSCAYSEGMKNIMLSLDDDVYSKAEEKAVALRKSVSEVAVDYLRHWAFGDASVEQARQHMAAMFAQPNWRFAVGTLDDRTLRNARR